MAPPPAQIDPPASFEAALAELESLVGQLERGELPLAESLAAYRRGAELIRYAQAELAQVEQAVRVLEGEVLKPIDEPPNRSEADGRA
ncbi:MAG: exodeoxyribonuclease VII small subunit [Casimicrobiaceae bacterium]|nr:exodeoxyribonuclease VII small subunit [Casimicrobiaceae bacterium]MCX8097654.1 exodeoxyribonuclease VII small subunit [Casimicrobiaceae bacterium]MDW8311846.1 exodeoxyribonuclease VII small subunit [Burkholderiales bacterium]